MSEQFTVVVSGPDDNESDSRYNDDNGTDHGYDDNGSDYGQNHVYVSGGQTSSPYYTFSDENGSDLNLQLEFHAGETYYFIAAGFNYILSKSVLPLVPHPIIHSMDP